MPDDRGRTKRDDAARLLQSPAKIDIVAGRVIFGIEAADLLKGPAIKRHITTRNVFGDCVGQQNVTRSARRSRDARLDRILRGRTDVRTANAGVLTTGQRSH